MFFHAILFIIPFFVYKFIKYYNNNTINFGWSYLFALYKNNTEYFLPPMSFEQIVNLINIQELNINNMIVSGDSIYSLTRSPDNNYLITYYPKEKDSKITNDYLGLSMDMCEYVFIMPKKKRDYVKLCKYYTHREETKESERVNEAQLKNLQNLRKALNDIEERESENLKHCAEKLKEML